MLACMQGIHRAFILNPNTTPVNAVIIYLDTENQKGSYVPVVSHSVTNYKTQNSLLAAHTRHRLCHPLVHAPIYFLHQIQIQIYIYTSQLTGNSPLAMQHH